VVVVRAVTTSYPEGRLAALLGGYMATPGTEEEAMVTSTKKSLLNHHTITTTTSARRLPVGISLRFQ
jgi:hypothetical protein